MKTSRFVCGVIVGLMLMASTGGAFHQARAAAAAALHFDGFNDGLNFGPDLFRDVTNTFTIEIWAFPTAARPVTPERTTGTAGVGGQRYAVLPQQGGIVYGSGAHTGAGLSVGTNGVSVFEHSDFFMPSVLVHTGSLSGWTHLALVYASGVPRLYVNGVFVRAGLASGKIVHASANLGDASGTYGGFEGTLDELRVWTIALEEATIQGWWNRELSANHPAIASLAGHWPLNEGAGTITADASGRGNGGNLLNGVQWVVPGAPYLPGPYPIVITGPVAAVGSTQASFEGSVNPQGHDTVAWFEWGTNVSYDFTSVPQSAGNGNAPVTVSGWATNLAALGAYSYRVAASNSAGVAKAIGRPFVWAPPTVSTLAAESVSADSAVLRGSVTPKGFPATAWFEWGPDTSYDQRSVAQTVGSSELTATVTQAVSGLVIGTDYHYRVVATNTVGLEAGLDMRFRTQSFSNAAVLHFLFHEGEIYWGDFDNDGWTDVLAVMTDFTNGDTYKYHNASGVLTQEASPLPRMRQGCAALGDYNNDGRQDILFGGNSLGSPGYVWGPMCRVFRNEGTAFIDINAGLPAVSLAAVAWGDYDNDGDLDILVSGSQAGWTIENPITRVYRNDFGAFTDIQAGLPGLGEGNVAWGDYDADGDLDFVLTGRTNSYSYPNVSAAFIYRNDGGSFIDAGAALPGLSLGSASWGDYDNDGDLDLLLVGVEGWPQSGTWRARVYRNDQGSFVDANVGLPSAVNSGAAWADYDGDGDLDVFISGNDYYGVGPLARVYENEGGAFTDINAGLDGVHAGTAAWGDYDNDGRLDLITPGTYGRGLRLWRSLVQQAPTNPHLPSPPGNLSASVRNNGARLQWSAATDPHTPSPGLTYNVRVGTAPLGVQIVAPTSDPLTGRLRVPQMGNAQHRLFALVTNLSIGTYYWSAQAVNGAFGGSAWAPEEMFSISHSVPAVTTLAARHVRCCSATLHGAVTPGNLPTMTWFEWGPTTNLGQITARQTPGSGLLPVPMADVLSGLTPRTRYYFQFTATNDLGVVPGGLLDFTTGPPVPMPTTLAASNITSSSATMMGDGDAPEATAEFFFEWGTTTNYGQRTALMDSGAALAIPGGNNYVTAGNGKFPTVTSNFTFEFWAYPTAALTLTVETNSGVSGGGGQRYAVMPEHGQISGYPQPDHVGAGVSVGTNGVIVFEHTANYLPSLLVHTGSLSGWTHVAVVYSNNLPFLFLNGQHVWSGLRSTKQVHPSANLCGTALGSYPPSHYGTFAGRLDEYRIWNAVLSPATVRDWMHRALTPDHPAWNQLLLYWPLNEGQGTNTADVSGNGRNGALFNDPLWIGESPMHPNAVAFELSRLLPDTEYYFRLVGTNAGGVVYGEDRMFRTLPGAVILSLAAETPGAFHLQCRGMAAATYDMEASTNLTTWTVLTNLPAGPDGQFEFRDADTTASPWRFYRLRQR